MTRAQKGHTVAVHYTGKLADGTLFDSSREREPIQFVLGEPGIIPGFQDAVEGLQPGERVVRSIPAEQAYGDWRPELQVRVERSRLPEELSVKIGQHLQLSREDGREFTAKVSGIQDDSITIDANHPLAGKELTFDIELVSVK